MTPSTTTQPGNDKTWINGKNPAFEAVSFHVYDGRLFMGNRGYSRKARGNAYVQNELPLETALHVLGALYAHILEISNDPDLVARAIAVSVPRRTVSS